MDQEIQAARDKLAARFANQTQIGGKGKYLPARAIHPRDSVIAQVLMGSLSFRHPEKKEEACYSAECQRGQEA